MSALLLAGASPLVVAGCAQPLDLPSGAAAALPDASVGDGGNVGPATTPSTTDEGAPTVLIAEPATGATVAEALHVRCVAKDDKAVTSVFVRVGPNVPVPATLASDGVSWSIDVKSPVGTFEVEAIAYDEANHASAPAKVTLSRPSTASDDAAPTVTIDAPDEGSTPVEALVLVGGKAADDRGVVRMELWRNGALLTERSVETSDFYAHWVRLVPLLPGEDNALELRAYDAAGHVGTAKRTLHGRPQIDTEAPSVAITTPTAAATVTTASLAVSGTAFDRTSVREVKARVGVVAANGDVTWSDYAETTTQDGFAHWAATLPIAAGSLKIQARAIDVSGLATSAEVAITNAYVPEWSSEVVYPLRLRDTELKGQLQMDLDRAGVNEVITPDIQKTIRLLDVDARPLMTNTVTAIKTACGTSWQQDNKDPKHDCSLTPLGQSFGADWRASPEYSLVRILTMTPANVVVAGTSISKLEGLANTLGIGGGFNTILAEVLGIAKTREVVPTDAVVTALVRQWMATHPYLAATAGALPVTLFDAMSDLAPMGNALGPAGSHPGVLDPSVTPKSVVFGSDFRMRILAQSNLVWHDGVVLAKGKDYVASVVDTNGGNDVVEFDFTDPNKFQIDGLVAAPTVDLRFRILENNAFISTCTGDSCKDNRPGTSNPRGAWAIPSWQLESIIGYAAYSAYGNRTGFDKCYSWFLIPCAAHVWVGAGSDPTGWAKFDTVLSLGSPPDNQYIWDLINETSQVALHNLPGGVTLAEGLGNVAFTVKNIPVGITADQMRAAVRPVLQNQKAAISSRLLGNYAANNGAVDFFLDRDGSNEFLAFVDALDPLPSRPTHTKPGFFDDPDLTKKASQTVDDLRDGAGGVMRERLPITRNMDRVVYARDASGALYRLHLTTPATGTDASVTVARRTR